MIENMLIQQQAKRQGLHLFATWSALLDRRAKDVRIPAVIVPELKLCDIPREVLAADFMERPDDTTLEDRPEAFNVVGVNVPMHVISIPVIDHPVRERLVKLPVAQVFIGRDQADPVRYRLTHKLIECVRGGVLNHPSDDVPFALDRPDYDFLARPACPPEVSAPAFSPVLVLGFPPDKGFVNLNIADQFAESLFSQASAYPMAHTPGGAIGTHSDHAIHLEGTNALLADQHPVHDREPRFERVIRGLQDRRRQDRKTVTRAWSRAAIALPVPRASNKLRHLVVVTTRAANTMGPAVRHQVRFACVLIRKPRLKFPNGHLMNRWFSFCHLPSPLFGLETV